MTKRPRIYLDHAATTPILPAAKAAMIEAMDRWANPSSPHAEGRAARAALEDARERIKRALGWDGELIFTSGATEAIEIALKRAKGGDRFISAVEHDAVFRAAPDAELLYILDHYEVSPDSLEARLRGRDRPVVAIQAVNSETGKMQPVDELSSIVRAAGGLIISDCAQEGATWRLPDADMIVLSGHKVGGPPGVGALLVRSFEHLEAQGGQEQGYRGGTENLVAILGWAAALESRSSARVRQSGATHSLEFEIMVEEEGGAVLCRGKAFDSDIIACSMPHLSAAAQLIQFDRMGLAVSAGSACSSGSIKPSRALRAFGVPDDVIGRTIRVSFGWSTSWNDIGAFADAWFEVAHDAKKRAA